MRTAAQIREEEQLIAESRRIEAQSKRIIKDRQNVVRLLAAVDASLAPPSAMRKANALLTASTAGSHLAASAGGTPDGKLKKHKRRGDAEGAGGAVDTDDESAPTF